MEDELKTDALNIGSKGQHDLRKTIIILYKDNMNTEKLINFMTRLIADSKKKVFLVLDNLRVHHAKLVQFWVEEHKDRIDLFFLPPYSPEYNRMNCSTATSSAMPARSSPPDRRQNLRQMFKTVWTFWHLLPISSLLSSSHPLPSMLLDVHDFIGVAI